MSTFLCGSAKIHEVSDEDKGGMLAVIFFFFCSIPSLKGERPVPL